MNRYRRPTTLPCYGCNMTISCEQRGACPGKEPMKLFRNGAELVEEKPCDSNSNDELEFSVTIDGKSAFDKYKVETTSNQESAEMSAGYRICKCCFVYGGFWRGTDL